MPDASKRPHAAEDLAEALPLSALHDTGVLWLINRVVFHPRGFALAIDVNRETGEVTGWTLLGDGTEPWRFAEDRDNVQYAAVEAFIEAHRA